MQGQKKKSVGKIIVCVFFHSLSKSYEDFERQFESKSVKFIPEKFLQIIFLSSAWISRFLKSSSSLLSILNINDEKNVFQFEYSVEKTTEYSQSRQYINNLKGTGTYKILVFTWITSVVQGDCISKQ